MNPVVQIGKIKIAQETLQLLLPALPMFYNYYIVNVIIIILCQLTRFFVHRVKTTIKKIEKYIVSRNFSAFYLSAKIINTLPYGWQWL